MAGTRNHFRLGAARNGDDVRQCAAFRGSAAARSALEVVTNYWKHTLGAINVERRSIHNMLANGCCLSTMACRCGDGARFTNHGAFGFRISAGRDGTRSTEPGLCVRICFSAHHVIQEGCSALVHPPLGRGVRTVARIFPLAAIGGVPLCFEYRDTGVLMIHPFLEGRPLKPEENVL